jgi:hypothetical protein
MRMFLHVNLENYVFVRIKDDGKEALSIDYQAFLHLMDRSFVKEVQGKSDGTSAFPILPSHPAQ